MNAIFPRRRPGQVGAKYSASSIPPEAIEASQQAVRGYSISRVLNAERAARLGAIYGTCGMLFGIAGWLTVWGEQPLKRTVDHWAIWDGEHAVPYVLQDYNDSVKNETTALDQYFAGLYVTYRVRYYYDLVGEDRQFVAWQTGKDEMAEYNHQTDPKNPDAPIIAIAKNGFREVYITGNAVEFSKDTGRYHSVVRYTMREQRYGSPHAAPVHRIADFTWEKRPDAVPEAKRHYSPIGMVVIHFHDDKDGE
jgi:type IV secretory pathway component VirB8